MRDTVAGACLCSLMLTLASPSASHTADARPSVLTTRGDVASLRVVRARQYRMAGGVRPLLFWINRDDIGLARITWRRGRRWCVRVRVPGGNRSHQGAARAEPVGLHRRRHATAPRPRSSR